MSEPKWPLTWVEAVEAFSHPCWEVQRLLELAAERPAESDKGSSRRQPFRPFKLDDRVDGEQVALVVAEYEAGTPTTELARIFKLGKGSVLKLLHEAGVEMRRQGLSERQITQAQCLYERGLSLEKVGRALGVDAKTVWSTLKKRGVRMRDTHGRKVDTGDG